MAVTTQNSTEYAAQIAVPNVKQAAYVLGGKVRRAYFTHVQSGQGDPASLVNLVELPAGAIRIVGAHLNCSALGSSRTMDFGRGAYVDMDGDTQAADEDAFLANIDVSSAVNAFQYFVNAAGPTGDIISKEGVVITAQVNDGTLDDGETINGFIEYLQA